MDARVLKAVQDICLDLPGAIETTTFGHPTFQAGPKKTFAVLDDHEQPDMLCLVVKLEPAIQGQLIDGKTFFPSKFGAKHGWTSIRVDASTQWSSVRPLVAESYRIVAPKRLRALMEGAIDPSPARRPSTKRGPPKE